MGAVIREIGGWLAFLQRPTVLVQLLPLALVLVALVPLRRQHRLPALLPGLLPALLLAEGVLALVLMVAGQPWGLVLLLGQCTLAWVALGLLESRLLPRWLAPVPRQVLDSRLLRPLVLVAIGLVLLDAVGGLSDLQAVPLGVWFGSPISLGQLSGVLFVLYLVLVGLDLPARGLSLLLQRCLHLSDGSRRALDQILRYVILALGVVWALTTLGINRTGLLAVAGGLSVGLGFGIKEVVANIVSGLWLLIEGSVRPGEVLIHDGEACEVRRLGPRAAVLWRRADNAELVVPNQTFFTSSTTTYTGSDRTRRCMIDLAVPLSLPPAEVLQELEAIVNAQPGVLRRPPVVARLLAFGSDTYRYSVAYSIADPLQAGAMAAALRLAIHRHFDGRGITPMA
ncbi:MAG: mechanosensitive ion channel family protein [Synechococcaceae cyanobacterium]